MPSFVCRVCQKDFQVSDTILAKFPGWNPQQCLTCKNQREPNGRAATGSKPPFARNSSAPRMAAASSSMRAARGGASREENLTVAEVLAKYTAGPIDGVFTDGAAEPNPGPGGWGVVYVKNNVIVAEKHGHEPYTTNNRMELRALIEGCALVGKGEGTVLYTDSQLCVNTITQWAKGW